MQGLSQMLARALSRHVGCTQSGHGSLTSFHHAAEGPSARGTELGLTLAIIMISGKRGGGGGEWRSGGEEGRRRLKEGWGGDGKEGGEDLVCLSSRPTDSAQWLWTW